MAILSQARLHFCLLQIACLMFLMEQFPVWLQIISSFVQDAIFVCLQFSLHPADTFQVVFVLISGIFFEFWDFSPPSRYRHPYDRNSALVDLEKLTGQYFSLKVSSFPAGRIVPSSRIFQNSSTQECECNSSSHLLYPSFDLMAILLF